METENEESLSGEELYRRFRAGDEIAFEKIVGLYRESLTRYILRFISDVHDAEELLIDAFAELAVDKKYKGQSSLKTYLFSIGRNITLKHVRKYKLFDTVPVDDIAYEAEDQNNPVDVNILIEEEKKQVDSAMRSLKQEYREVLHLIYFEDMSYADAGQTMQKSVKQITALAHRAKKSLRSLLENEGAGNGTGFARHDISGE